MGNLDFIYNRKSIRKFKDEPVPKEDLLEIIKAATYAPSGKNLQNWHFVVVTDKNKIHAIADAVIKKNHELSTYTKDEEKAIKFRKSAKYHTIFKNAPAIVLIYGGKYPTTGLDLLKEKENSSKEIHDLLRPSPGVQNIAAAMENMLLAASELGYGGCWMTGPTYAAKEISEILNFDKKGFFLTCMTPIGVPESTNVSQPKRKDVNEVCTFI